MSTPAGALEGLSLNNIQEFWGPHHHLYDTLSNDECQSLEAAILAHKLGQLREARRIFESELPSPDTLPVLAIARAGFEARASHWSICYEILDSALHSQSQWRGGSSGREAKLLQILRAKASLYAHGSVRAALKAARKMRDEWEVVSLEHWTSIEVSIHSKL